MQTVYSYLLNWLNMAKFKITKSTTVAELKEQFRSEVGGVLRVYEGRSEAPEDATLVSLGAKEGDLECRTSRTVGKFIEAFQSELGLKVKVYTKDNWVSVLDGITLATVREIPKNARKAQMEQYLAYQRDEKEEDTEDAKADEVEIPEEIKGIPLFDIHMIKVEWPFMTEKEIDEHSDELGDCGIVHINGGEADDMDGDVVKYIFAGDTDDGMYRAVEFIDDNKDDFENPSFEAWIAHADDIKIYGLDEPVWKVAGSIGKAMDEFVGGTDFFCFNWELETPALFRVKYDDEEDPNVFSIDENGYYDTGYDSKQFEKLVKLTEAGENKPKPKVFNPDDYYFSNGLAIIEKNGKQGFVDTEGNLVIDCIYDKAWDFNPDTETTAVKKDGKWGLIDKKGSVVVDFIYDQISWFSEGLASVNIDYKHGFIDAKGNLIVDCIYDNAFDFEDGVAAVEKDGKWGLIDKKGSVVVDFIYDNTRSFSDGVASFKKDGKWGLIDKKGTVIVDFIYDDEIEFCGGLAKVEKDGKEFKIDTKGNVVEE